MFTLVLSIMGFRMPHSPECGSQHIELNPRVLANAATRTLAVTVHK